MRRYVKEAAVAHKVEEELQEEEKQIKRLWTGFTDKTMWDWLTLFGTLAIPVVVLCATIVFSIQQEQISQVQHDNELRIAEANRQNDLRMATNQQEEATLAAYLDGITGLLLDNKQASTEVVYQANIVARAKTMIVLHRLSDSLRKSMVVQFLYEAHLITGKQPRVSLVGVSLAGVDLRRTAMSGINLSGADLSGADLRNADLKGADLSGADLHNTDIKGADLSGARISRDQLLQVKARSSAS